MADAMLMVDGCGMTRMCSSMAGGCEQPLSTLRQTDRAIYDEKEALAGIKKRDHTRREIVVEDDLLRGVSNGWQGEKTLVVAMDASALSDRLTILSFRGVYRGCGLRVAWTITKGEQEGAWRPHWERMLRQLAEAVPTDGTGDVMADRGFSAAWWFRAIQANGWHPFLRVTKGLSFRGRSEEVWGTVGERVKKPGREWKGAWWFAGKRERKSRSRS
ncbi:MAG TPA: hypothetical protein VGF67_11105 [Ktedonobacteraceae bacterium]|jgi:hypothetical protein